MLFGLGRIGVTVLKLYKIRRNNRPKSKNKVFKPKTKGLNQYKLILLHHYFLKTPNKALKTCNAKIEKEKNLLEYD